jgi:acetyl-CoA decarbonylase/synthase complex subunit gamma
MSPNVDALRAAGEAIKATRPLLWAMNASANADAVIALAKELNLPLCVEAPGFEPLAAIASKARDAGIKDLVLSPGITDAGKGLAFLSQSRRAAIMKKYRPMGYPVAMIAMDGDADVATVDACWYILKYAGIVVTNVMQPARVLAMMATRGDIYTNPQVPVQVESGLHTVGDPGPDSPVLITTNFALSYYSVESEVSSARIPAYILAVDTEGTSVLTAWAADKFTGQSIAQAISKSGLSEKVSHKQVILPGLVAVLSAGVEEESGWKVMVGPREASGIASYLKSQLKS